ncbi:cytochrome oxidase Cu insertion factor (SCO1/SenC/PrrC family) [Methanohalophilus levihalophilus]|uniref:TlpA family protein disulfide reductase n=1 Tax=Methanohalophilus levihalophilus TaxID=1431282 RepID=UPI001AE7B05F|nr:redoxin family protein [Methanohalophilus levihalophilus]MBP2029903.1 cytochrome oxidase Cu insertion factor (SCO1/SenC/PrrC family) [Methanohalophilus levihalophilus]
MAFKKILALAVVISFLFISGCTEQGTTDETPAETVDWKNMELTDIATGETFRISDFEGTPVLIESFAVWCPTCLRQQREMQELIDLEGDRIIHISLDTDPNEDEEAVREHFTEHGFEWYFAVPPDEYTQALIDEFGLEVVNAPGAPVILVCEDQSTRFLQRNVKSAEELIAEVEEGC